MGIDVKANKDRYDRLLIDTKVCAEFILDDLMAAARKDPDKVRDVLGSVSFRKLEEYGSLKQQSEAAFEEWIHGVTSVD